MLARRRQSDRFANPIPHRHDPADVFGTPWFQNSETDLGRLRRGNPAGADCDAVKEPRSLGNFVLRDSAPMSWKHEKLLGSAPVPSASVKKPELVPGPLALALADRQDTVLGPEDCAISPRNAQLRRWFNGNSHARRAEDRLPWVGFDVDSCLSSEFSDMEVAESEVRSSPFFNDRPRWIRGTFKTRTSSAPIGPQPVRKDKEVSLAQGKELDLSALSVSECSSAINSADEVGPLSRQPHISPATRGEPWRSFEIENARRASGMSSGKESPAEAPPGSKSGTRQTGRRSRRCPSLLLSFFPKACFQKRRYS